LLTYEKYRAQRRRNETGRKKKKLEVPTELIFVPYLSIVGRRKKRVTSVEGIISKCSKQLIRASSATKGKKRMVGQATRIQPGAWGGDES